MTAALTPEEVEAQLRGGYSYPRLLTAAADALADLHRERDELRRIHDEITHALESAGYAHMSNGAGIAHICSELEAAERALAEARAERDSALSTVEFINDVACSYTAECDRQREHAEEWKAAAEGEQERIANLLCIAGAWLAADWVRALPPPTIKPSVTDTEKANG